MRKNHRTHNNAVKHLHLIFLRPEFIALEHDLKLWKLLCGMYKNEEAPMRDIIMSENAENVQQCARSQPTVLKPV